MRTTKRFTPTLLARFAAEGRGTGTYQDYIPWHRVGRGDPASSGRSHLLGWRRRQRELLSDVERVGHYFSFMLPDVGDSCEQFPLTLESARHEITAFDACADIDVLYPGTLELAGHLGIKHFILKDKRSIEPWRYSTDHLLVFKKDGRCSLLAVAYKPPIATLRKRDREKLSLERKYWLARGVEWLLITPDVYDKHTKACLERTACWVVGAQVEPDLIPMAVKATNACLGLSLTTTLTHLAGMTGSLDMAQRAFWQAVWCGAIPLDLRRGWRPHAPLQLLTAEQFAALNPIRSRRSAWN